MKLPKGHHLAYCTNIHRGENWPRTMESLEQFTLKVRDQVSNGAPYAIGLRLGDQASRELSDPATLATFKQWLAANNCYVFTINGFPYGSFHGTRVKEQVFLPDWSNEERLAYTCRLFDLLVELLPPGEAGSVSTVPGSHKELVRDAAQEAAIRRNLWRAVDHMAALSKRTGRDLHLGLEPEPLGYIENTAETLRFFEQFAAERPGDTSWRQHLGVNYDTCHLAIEYEHAGEALGALQKAGIRVSKLHFSSALKVHPTPETLKALPAFLDVVYFHQVIARTASGGVRRHRDLDAALEAAARGECAGDTEWRIHFHVPLHCAPNALFDTTAEELQDAMTWLAANPEACQHIEMETYTWEVLPADMKQRSVVDQLVEEYRWTLGQMSRRGLA